MNVLRLSMLGEPAQYALGLVESLVPETSAGGVKNCVIVWAAQDHDGNRQQITSWLAYRYPGTVE